MEFDIAEDFLRYFISYLSGERNEHGFCKRFLYEFFNDREVVSCEWSQVLCLRAESEGYSELKKKSDVEVAEVASDGVQQLYALLAPFIQTLL